VSALPPGFEGQDFPALFRALAYTRKGELETSVQHEARKPVPPPTVHAFVVKLDETAYDADAALFRISFRTAGDLKGGLLPLVDDIDSLSTYEATNAFGVAARVSKMDQHRWGIQLSHGVPNRVRLEVPLDAAPSPERAAALQKSLRVLAVVRLGPESATEVWTADKLQTGFDHTAPTLQRPREVSLYEHVMRAKVLALWVYDRESGEVLGRFDFSGHRLTPEGELAPQTLAPADDVWTVRDRLRAGMTMDQVAELARPLRPKVVKRPGKRQEWTYMSWLTVEFADGKLVGMRSPSGQDVMH
jgi:hypothetical protein